MGVVVLLLAAAAVTPAAPPSVSLPAERAELLIDNHVVESMTGLTRRVIQPTPHESNPRIITDLPWEQRLVTYNSAVWDPIAGKHRMWYLASPSPTGIPAGTYPGTGEYPIGHAESTDASVPVEWARPMVGQPYGEYAETNLVLPDSHGWTVVIDPEAPEAERYKGIGGRSVGVSSDGLSWTVHDGPWLNDTSPALFRWGGKWIALGRTSSTWENGVLRRVSYTEAVDFLGPWSDPVPVPSLDTDATDGTPWVQPYQIAVEPWGGQLVGVLRHIRLEEQPGNNTLGLTTSELVTSRDGFNWTRTRQPWLWPLPGWSEGGIVPGARFYRHDGRIVMIYAGTPYMHGEPLTLQKYNFGLATLPADRFQCIEGSGSLMTRPIDTNGTRLVVNADGAVRISVLDQWLAPLAGFSATEMTRNDLGDIQWEAKWPGGTLAEARAAASGPVRLRIDVAPAGCLYGFTLAI